MVISLSNRMCNIIKKYKDDFTSHDENQLYKYICQKYREHRHGENDTSGCSIEDWGGISLVKIDREDFWCLIDELIDDRSGFLCNRTTILNAYTAGNLYGLRVVENESMRTRRASRDNIFCNDIFNDTKTCYLLPCFCIRESDTAIIIWTHTRARNMGFATQLVKLLDIKYADTPLPESMGFWQKCNIGVETQQQINERVRPALNKKLEVPPNCERVSFKPKFSIITAD